MARTLELDTLDHPGNTGIANIVLSSDGTTTMPVVNINGGQIDATTVGASTPSSVAATTLTASGNATVGGTLGITGNTTAGGTLGVTGNTTAGGTLGVTGNTTVGGTLGVTGNTTVGGTLGVTGDVTVTGGDIKSSGGTTAISISGANTTLAGTANNIGTTTAGTITNGVTQDGVVRLVKVVKVTGAEFQAGNTTSRYAPHDAIVLPVTTGKTYLIETSWYYWMNDQSDPQQTGSHTCYWQLHNHSASVDQGDSAAAQSSTWASIWSGQTQLYTPTSVMDPPGVKGFGMKQVINAKGAFTAGATEDRYIFISHSNMHYDDRTWVGYDTQYYFMYEVTGVSVTSLVNTYPY
jgi:hypothetical protein